MHTNLIVFKQGQQLFTRDRMHTNPNQTLTTCPNQLHTKINLVKPTTMCSHQFLMSNNQIQTKLNVFKLCNLRINNQIETKLNVFKLCNLRINNQIETKLNVFIQDQTHIILNVINLFQQHPILFKRDQTHINRNLFKSNQM
eukprot:406466_1